MTDTNDILNAAASRLAQRTPELDAEKLTAFVTGFIRRRERFLEVNAEHGSPLYVLERNVLVERARQFSAAFRDELPDVRVYYAVKSNNHPLVARVMVEEGLGLDVSSGQELQAAIAAGAGDIVFSGPGKTPEELLSAVGHRGRVTVLVDSFGELQALQAVSSSMKAAVRAGVRVTTGTHGIWRKFGIPLSDLPRFLDAADPRGGVTVCGLQSHLSWNMDPSRHVEVIKAIGLMLGRLPGEHRSRIEFIDIGGGFWPPRGEWLQEAGTDEGRVRYAAVPGFDQPLRHFERSAVGIRQFASEIGNAVRDHIFPRVPCRICLEPGRWLCSDAMHLLMTVIDKKAGDLLVTDAGTNAIGGECFVTDYTPLINLSRPGIAEHRCLVTGSLCTPHDVWGHSYHGAEIEPGDVLLVPCQGAYTYSLRQHFIKPLPEVVCIDHG